MTDEIMSFKEAMSYLKIPRSTLYKLVQEKRVPAIKIGRHWRFSKSTLDKWIAGDNNEDDSLSDVAGNGEDRLYCWQGNGRKLDKDHRCTECLTYRVRALNCFLLRNVVEDDMVLCNKPCRECEYFIKNFD